MRRISGNLLIAIVFIVVLGALGWWTAVLKQDPILQDTLLSGSPLAAKTTLTGSYLSGRIARNQGDVNKAALYLAQALEAAPDNKELLAQTVKAKLLAGDMEGALVLSKRMAAANKEANFPQLLEALVDIKQKDYKAAREDLKTNSQDELNSVLIPLINAWLDVGEGKVTHPMELKDAMKKMEPFAPFLYYQLALMNDLAGYDKDALSYYQRSIEEAAKMPYRVVESLGNYYERHGMIKEANTLYTRYREATPDSALFDVQVQDARNPNDRLIPTATEGVAEVFFSVASIFFTEDSLEEALVHLRMALFLRPDFPPAQLMLGNALEQTKDYDAALAAYASINPHSPFYLKGRLRSEYVRDLQGNTEQALADLRDISKEYPDRYDAYLTSGDILRRHDRYQEATQAYTEAVKRIPTLKPNHWTLFYARAISHERTGSWELAEKDFQKALELEPAQPDVLNYLGYSWLVMGKNITEARNMIEQAIAKRPGDAHIIDSMGWALYSQNDFNGALRYLERAVSLTPDDPTVNDHLGDVYWRLGRQTEARFQWDKALIFKPDEKDAKLIRQKLADGLPPMAPAPKIGTAENNHDEPSTSKQ